MRLANSPECQTPRRYHNNARHNLQSFRLLLDFPQSLYTSLRRAPLGRRSRVQSDDSHRRPYGTTEKPRPNMPHSAVSQSS
jgi:hypothetical protein